VAAEPFEVSITEGEIADLRERLRRARWPEPEPVDDWSQGLPLAYAQELSVGQAAAVPTRDP
jgi:hypothetical protein